MNEQSPLAEGISPDGFTQAPPFLREIRAGKDFAPRGTTGKVSASKQAPPSQQAYKVSTLGAAKTMVNYLVNDIQKKPRSFKIGIFSIFLVIGFLCAIQSIFQMAPVIFLTLAENQTGDQDVLMTPVPFQNRTDVQSSDAGALFDLVKLLNYTELNGMCDGLGKYVEGCSPRWLLTGDLLAPPSSQQDQEQPASGDAPPAYRGYIVAIDPVQERSIGLGRRLKAPLLQNLTAYVTESTMRGLGLQTGDMIRLQIDILKLLQTNNLLNLDSVSSSSQSTLDANATDGMPSDEATAYRVLVRALDTANLPLGDLTFTNTQTPESLRETADTLRTTADDLRDGTVTNEEATQNAIDSFGVSVTDDVQDAFDQFTQFLQDNSDTLTSEQLALVMELIAAQVDAAADAQADNNIDGEDITLSLTNDEIARALAPIAARASKVALDVQVIASVRSPKGKWPSVLGNTLVADVDALYNETVRAIADNLDSAVNEAVYSSDDTLRDLRVSIAAFVLDQVQAAGYAQNVVIDEDAQRVEGVAQAVHEALDDVAVREYAMINEIVMKDRMRVYASGKRIEAYFVERTNEMFSALGFDYATAPAVPLGTAVQNFLMLKLFLDNMVSTAVFILVLLAIVLIYSLMISDVEEKTYEFGMLRALGLKKGNLVALLVLQALSFAFPGLFLGLLLAYLLNSVLAYLFFSSAHIVYSYEMHYSAVALGFALGTLIPLLSNYFPIQRALGKTLKDSLDLYHRVVSETTVMIMKLEKLGLSPSQLIISILLVLIGIVCYYFVPQAFLNEDVSLFLAIVNIVLMLMILGMTLLAHIFEPALEKLIVNVMFLIFQRDATLKVVVNKNMDSHRRRNEKTTLMYSIALAFLIFTGTGFNLQTSTIAQILASFVGSDIYIGIPDSLVGQYSLDEVNMRAYMQKYMNQYPDQVQGFTFLTPGLHQWPQVAWRSRISPLCGFPSSRLRIYGIEKEFLYGANTNFFIPTEYQEDLTYDEIPDGKKDMVKSLYDRPPDVLEQGLADTFNVLSNKNQVQQQEIKQALKQVNIIIPEGYRIPISVSTSVPALLSFNRRMFQFRTQIRGMAQKFPGRAFSKYQSIQFFGEAVISLEDYRYIIDQVYGNLFNGTSGDLPDDLDRFNNSITSGSSYGLPKQSMLVRFARDVTIEEKDVLLNGLRSYFTSDQIDLIDVPNLVQTTNEAIGYITLFSIAVGTVAITLSFFLIIVSFTANVRENSWEFGVLRAIGLNKGQIMRCYLYEAVSLIMSSGLLGSLVGMLVAVTLTLQFVMFLELEFVFLFPYAMFFFCFSMGIVVSIGGAYFAILQFKDKSISSIVKGLA